MSDFYSDFSGVEPDEWMSKVVKDLKGKKPEDVLSYEHPVENISYKAYAFSNDEKDNKGTPDTPPFLRGTSTSNNNWVNKVSIPLSNAETTNKLALHHLMNGADGLHIDLNNFTAEDCDLAVKGIGFEYISTSFTYHTADQENWLKNNFESKRFDISLETSLETSALTLPAGKSITIDGTHVQLYGGNVSQEIAWCLHRAHDHLYTLLNEGLPIDEAEAQIKFKLGIGGNYFFEIAKIRSLRSLWYSVVQQYTEDKSLGRAHIEAQTGFLNKSLKDPHTNLLRQTTEALSAVIGGVEELTILPYNWLAKKPNLDKTQRHATNIGLLLKEESYMDKVIDPSGGSYSIEMLTEKVADHAWELFQLLEGNNRESFEAQLNSTKKKRIELIESKELTYIGVNKYFNTDKPVDEWGELPVTPFGESLILENTVKVEA